MSGFQRYLFRNVLRTLIAIVGGLALIALLTQGLSQIDDTIVQNRQSMLAFLWVSVLATPQIISLLMPIALFIATAAALNVAHRENEVVVAQASGMSNWQVASPVLRLATLAAILHLGLNLWIQPTASRELRTTSHNGLDGPRLLAGARGHVHDASRWPHDLRGQRRWIRDHLPRRQ